jgi:dolichol-phosphate mannosyltransferase
MNEETNIAALHERVSAAARSWGEDYELIVVDDGSTDRTLEICEAISAADPRMRVVSFSRNFGHQAAIAAGLQHCSGEMVAIIDGDLQDPPEQLLRFIEKCREGFDVVYAIRARREDAYFKRLSSYVYYRLLKRIATLDIPLDAGDFCVMKRAVADSLNALPERNRYIRGLRSWVGYRQMGLAFERPARRAGQSKYTLSKMLRLAMDGFVNFSRRPLQLALILGAAFILLAALSGILAACLYFGGAALGGYNPRQSPGWTSLMLAILFFSGIQLIALGILGEYVGRIFDEIKGRPMFIVRKRVNFQAPR